ncbi:MAG TPA: two-component regulator propeller domain-containing protein [Lentimicrobium sp.]|nr:two-component regulator propeller domain-containing protein [Lentimicrobium sp.]
MKNSILYLTIALVFGNMLCFGQNDTWYNYTYGENIRGMAKENGLIWTTTYGGLVSTNIQTRQSNFYTSANSDLLTNFTTAITVAPDGSKWVASGYYVIKITDGEMLFYTLDDLGVPVGQDITSMATDASGNLWFGYGRGYQSTYGLGKFNGSESVFYKTSNSEMPDNVVNSISIIENIIWVGTNNGIARFDGTDWLVLNMQNSYLTGNRIYDIDIDTAGNKWVVVNGGGINMFNDTSWVFYMAVNSPMPSNQCVTLTIDSQDRKWIGFNYYDNDGALAMLSDSTWTIYTKENSGLPNNVIAGILEAEAGKIWIGTKEGLVEFDGTNWTKIITSNSGLQSNNTGFIGFESNGTKWIGEAEAVTSFDNFTWNSFDQNNTILPKADFYCVTVDNYDNKWLGFGLLSPKIAKYNDTTWQLYDVPNYSRVFKLAVDEDNNIWCGTQTGLHVFNGNQWTSYTEGNSGIVDDYIEDIVIADNGKVWIGTYEGLSSYYNGVWTNYTASNSPIPGNTIRALAVEPDGTLWVVTDNYNGDFAKFDGSDWTLYNTSEFGYPNDFIMEVAVDAAVDKWFSLQTALVKLHDNTFTVISSYDQGSGLPISLTYDLKVDYLNNKWLATNNGVVVYNENGIVLSADNKFIYADNIKVYPNPAKNFIQAELNKPCKRGLAELINCSGQVVCHSLFSGSEIAIILPDKALGLYILKVQTEDETFVNKVIIH